MANIEINTTQNVTIEYELAPLRDRIIAYILDLLIMTGIYILALFLFMMISKGKNMELFFFLFVLPMFLFYSLLFEIFNNGRSLGKAALNIKVVKITGQEPSLNDYITRWVFRMIDIYFSLGALASFLISSSDKNQRLGDILANTTIIKYKPNYNLHLSDLINRTTIENYQPKFPEVRKFKEEDMLLVKTVIERVRQYPNQAHYEALNLLVEKIKGQMNLKETPRDKVEFLKTLLKDYIILTR